jgi:glycosyltransferase involved in cell wall biosynthesis
VFQNPPRALLIIDEGSLVHNSGLVDRMRERLELAVRVRNKKRTRLAGRKELLASEALLFGRLLLSIAVYRPRSLLICSSGHYSALVVSRFLGPFHREVRVFLYNFYLHGLGRNAVIKRLLSFLLTERVLIVAQSTDDFDYFASLSRGAKLVFVPYCQGPLEIASDDDAALGDYVFAGGYTNRDYDRLLRCARRLPDVPFTIACSSLNRITESVPPNVQIHVDLDSRTFHRLLAGARLVVVPLAHDVGASGQMVTLAAMQLGKATVVPDSPSIAQYVEHGVSGILYSRSSGPSLCETIRAVYDEATMLLEVGAAARRRYSERFTRASFDDALLGALTEFAGVESPPTSEGN